MRLFAMPSRVARYLRVNRKPLGISIAAHAVVITLVLLWGGPSWDNIPPPVSVPRTTVMMDAGEGAAGGSGSPGDDRQIADLTPSQSAGEPVVPPDTLAGPVAAPPPEPQQVATVESMPPAPVQQAAPAPEPTPPAPPKKAEKKERRTSQAQPKAVAPAKQAVEPPTRNVLVPPTLPVPANAANRSNSNEVSEQPEMASAGPGQQMAAASPAPGRGAEGARRGAVGRNIGPGDDYFERLRRWLAQYRQYPQSAIERKEEGTVLVKFELARDGTVLSTRIVQSSGSTTLDQAAYDLLHRASPVPPFPDNLSGDRGTIVMPIDYHLGFFRRMF
jgi:protein TonB